MSTVEAVKAALEAIILDPQYAEFLAILKAARNGIVYGAKVRFPHALVMTFLFRHGTFRQKFWLVFKATRTHAQNLAKFAVIYKSAMLAMKYLGSSRSKEGPMDPFIAGLLGGYVVFGRANPKNGKVSSVSQQIVIYVFARVVLALAKLSVKPQAGIVTSPKLSSQISSHAWPVFAAGSWGAVMWVFRYYPDSLQSSLKSSMKYIYKDCDEWDSLRTFLIHNK